MSSSMPVKLSGPLVSEARRSAKLEHRSLTAQIEHWAALGKVIEECLTGATVKKLLAVDKTMKIGQVTAVTERQRVADILVQFVAQSPESSDTGWLTEIRRSGVSIYGTTADSNQITEMDRSGEMRPADVELAKG